MREQLIQYVDALFAGAPDKKDVQEEILQNTLDRYDDLLTQGKTPAAAYSLAIAGIGDVSEILGCASAAQAAPEPKPQSKALPHEVPTHKKTQRAVAVALYICCVLPVILFDEFGYETLGICLMFLMIAAATALIIMSSGGNRERSGSQGDRQPNKELHKAIGSITGVITLIVYLTLSFATGAWHITWLIFPVAGAVDGMIKAFTDLKRSTGSAVARIIIYFIVAVLLAILVAIMGYDLIAFGDGPSSETVTNQQSFAAEDIRHLEIEWLAGNITIVTADTDEITVTETGKFTSRYDMTYATVDGILQIDYAESLPVVVVGTVPAKDLTVTVPEDWICQSLELDAAAAEVNISGLSAVHIELDGAAMQFAFHGDFRTLSCDGAACKIKVVTQEAPESITVDGAACVIELTMPEDQGFRVQMEGMVCTFDSDRTVTGGAGLWRSGNEACLITANGVACQVIVH